MPIENLAADPSAGDREQGAEHDAGLVPGAGQMLSAARRSPETWNDYLDSFLDDQDLIVRIEAKSPRQQSAGYDLSCLK
ncbi:MULTISPECIES: hypothetical protein [unclassified Ensifer]|uniref:hypothetical protein n=1 Tax=unclassified Ensifer TaxID=2633371 RepID=UPI00115FD295|nr:MULTISPECIES: hypothetical protein [unclassified Ensifer]MBD9597745.1 hypothetical protein [Ensifer sp. ENS05]